MSGTAAADLERDGGGFLRGLERKSAIVSCDRRPAAQCVDTTAKGIGP